MECQLPVSPRGQHLVGGIYVLPKPLGCTTLRIFGVHDFPAVVHFDHVCEDRLNLFEGTWLFREQSRVINVLK
jgi:hypothetical protein